MEGIFLNIARRQPVSRRISASGHTADLHRLLKRSHFLIGGLDDVGVEFPAVILFEAPEVDTTLGMGWLVKKVVVVQTAIDYPRV